MSRPILLEVIALDTADATAARAGGADRLELVTDMAADGLTPSLATFAAVREAVGIPVRVMLRGSAGFAAEHVEALAAQAEALRGAGAEEFVFGFLDAAGMPDLAAVKVLADAVTGCPWTFHRAIDHAADRAELRRRLAGLPGLDAYLTAGAPTGVTDGLPVLAAEAAAAGADGAKTVGAAAAGEPRLLVGGGLKPAHVPRLRAAGLDAFHVGSAVRPGGWASPVDAALVAEWRTLVDV